MSKVSIIGVGEVGASCATCHAKRYFVKEIIIVECKEGAYIPLDEDEVWNG